MHKTALIVALAGVVLASSAAGGTRRVSDRKAAQIERGLAFAQQRCAACHGVTANLPSPNPESPPFEDIVNQPGLTAGSLRQYLRNSHNFPAAMDFTLARRDLNDLSTYMLTLRRANYRPGI